MQARVKEEPIDVELLSVKQEDALPLSEDLIALRRDQAERLRFPPSCAVVHTDWRDPVPKVVYDVVETAFLRFDTREVEYKLKSSGLVVPEKELQFGRGFGVWAVLRGRRIPLLLLC